MQENVQSSSSVAASHIDTLRMAIAQTRRKRIRTSIRGVALWVFAPTLIVLMYLGLLATPRYESEAVLMVKGASDNAVTGALAMLMPIGGSDTITTIDSISLVKFLQSREALAQLDHDHQWIKHFKNPQADFFNRLAKDVTFEDAYDFYLHQVRIGYDRTESVITLRVLAFSPEKATEFANALLGYGEARLNVIAERIRTDQLRYANEDLKAAEERLKNASTRLTLLQTQANEIDAQSTAKSILELIAGLEGELTKEKAQLNDVQRLVGNGSPRVDLLQSRIQSLQNQIDLQRKRLVDAGNPSLNIDLIKFAEAQKDIEISQKIFDLALLSLDKARNEAARQHRYVAVVVAPRPTDQEARPRIIRSTLMALCICMAVFAIIRLTVGATREHFSL